VHAVVAQRFNELVRLGDPPELVHEPGDENLIEELVAPAAEPDDRVLYADAVNGGWCCLGAACCVLMVAASAAVDAIAGHGAVRVVVTVGAGCGFGAVTGSFASLWYKHRAKQARRRARRHGAGSPGVGAAMRHTLPGAGTLALQAVVGVLSAIITASSV
jgi:hypothetical protein